MSNKQQKTKQAKARQVLTANGVIDKKVAKAKRVSAKPPKPSNSEKNTDKKCALSAEQSFLANLKRVNSIYIITVTTAALIVAGGIVCSVLWKMFLGLLIAIFGILLYVAVTNVTLHSRLGITYRGARGCLTVIALDGHGNEEIFIPKKVINLTVTELDDRCFSRDGSRNIRILHLPDSILLIGKDIFRGCDALTDIYFDGARAEFEKITVLTDLSPYVLHFKDKTEETEKTEKNEKNENQ